MLLIAENGRGAVGDGYRSFLRRLFVTSGYRHVGLAHDSDSVGKLRERTIDRFVIEIDVVEWHEHIRVDHAGGRDGLLNWCSNRCKFEVEIIVRRGQLCVYTTKVKVASF